MGTASVSCEKLCYSFRGTKGRKVLLALTGRVDMADVSVLEMEKLESKLGTNMNMLEASSKNPSIVS